MPGGKRKTFEEQVNEALAGGGGSNTFDQQVQSALGAGGAPQQSSDRDMMQRFLDSGPPADDGFVPLSQVPSRFILDTSTPQGSAELAAMNARQPPGPPLSPLDRAASYGRSALIGAGQGMGAGFVDDAAALGGAAIGMGREEALARAQANDARAQEENPLTYGAARFAGSMLPAAKLAKGLGVVGGAAAAGGLEGAGASDDIVGQPLQAAGDAGIGAVVGGVLGKAGDMVGDGVAGAYKWGRDKLQGMVPGLRDTADRQMLAQGGYMAGDFKRMRDQGSDPAQYAEAARRMGIGQDGWLPGTLDDYAAGASRAVGEQDAIRQGVLQANPNVVVDPTDLAAGTLNLRQNYSPGAGNNELRHAIGDVAQENWDTMPLDAQGMVPWDAVNNVRQTWGKGTNFASGTPRSNVRQDIYGELNNQLEQGIANTGDTAGAAAWRQAGRDEHVAIDMRDVAQRRQDQLSKNRLFSPSDYAAGLGGAALGGYGGYESTDNPYGAAAGAVAGGVMMNRFIRGREHGWASAGAGKLADALDGLPAGGGGGSMADRFIGSGAAMGTREFDESLDQGRGYLLTDAALGALQSEPQMLGSYAQQIAEAANSPQPGAVGALIARLSRTDPNFKMQVLPALRARTGAM